MNNYLALWLVIGIISAALLKQMWDKFQFNKRKSPINGLETHFKNLRDDENHHDQMFKQRLEQIAGASIIYQFGLAVAHGIQRIKSAETNGKDGDVQLPYYETTFVVPGEGEWVIRLVRKPKNVLPPPSK